jgi:tetratricopeptide (TPR) repeat protein
MIERYIPIYIIVTLIFSYAVSFYLKKRFPDQNEENRQKDIKRLAKFESMSLHKFLAMASLYKSNRVMATMFIFLFNIAIPIMGYIFTLWITWYFTHVKYEKKVVFTNILDLNEFKTNFMKVERVFGEGSMLNLLNNEYIPKSKKLRALASLASTQSPASLAIIKQTLSSRDDEIRLYGYSILNNLEKKINSKINSNLQIISETSFIKERSEKDDFIIANASISLAFSYWELVYMELSHESLKNNFLNSSISYIVRAKEFYSEKIDEISTEDSTMTKASDKLTEYYETLSSLYSLMGRIYLYKEQYEEAQGELTTAKGLLHENATNIIPYLAEVYYHSKKYGIAKSILNQYDSLRFNTKLYPIIKQWEA